MIYDIGDKVRVFWEDELYPDEVEIVWASDDEETFEVKSGQWVMQNIPRKHIFDGSNDNDKLALAMLEGCVSEADDVAEDYDSEFVQTYDVNLSAISDDIAYAFNDIDEMYAYIKRSFGYYGAQEVVYDKKEEMYYHINSN